MKRFVLIYVVFTLLIVNTSFFWGQFQGWDFLIGMLFMLLFYGLFLLLIGNVVLMFMERFKKKTVNRNVIILSITIPLVMYFPRGIIDFESLLYGEDIFAANIEGSANCTRTIKLKQNQRFYEEAICFGMSKKRGSYTIVNDTIWFIYDETHHKRYGVLERTNDRLFLNYRVIESDTII
ncbi:MAG: hypothetical protein AAF901_09445, partial [Bacteroidota bacterium]